MTNIGREREKNEDQYLIAELNKSMLVRDTSIGLDQRTRLFGHTEAHVLVVADGMGGQAAGERASTLAIDSAISYMLNTMHWLIDLDQDQDAAVRDDLKSSLEFCQARLRSDVKAMPKRHGMGTTLTLAYLIWPRLFVVHVGDSRCYLFRNGKLKQVTQDHTVAQKLVEGGILNPQEVETSQWSNVLWNVIGGGSDELEPEVHKAEMKIGDTLLLCTDGLTKHVSDAEIAQALASDIPAKELCQQLVEAANEAGGSDNLTVVIARFRTAEEARHAEAKAATQLTLEATESPAAAEPKVLSADEPSKVEVA